VANSAIVRIVKSVIQIAIIRCLVKSVQGLQLREVAQQGWNGASQTIVGEIPDRESGELSDCEIRILVKSLQVMQLREVA